MKAPKMTYARADSVAQALALLAEHGDGANASPAVRA